MGIFSNFFGRMKKRFQTFLSLPSITILIRQNITQVNFTIILTVEVFYFPRSSLKTLYQLSSARIH